ncbi:hypothetical protein KC717_03380 [Candidatus Dojkabacteria bacterium]|uniref:Uncharacterized protein n=1 Tax=Candidatus Dojkabacteria bacterium TaxID=2099670 RepID=A0A955L8M5_9BACT|nr:hypothetical protein [Candidatus Dojkabacteria bacterium]
MKILVRYIVIIFLLILPYTPLTFAQEGSQTLFTTQLYRGLQDPRTKTFTLTAEIESSIDSDRVSVIWQLPEGLRAESVREDNDFILRPGTNTATLDVTPRGQLNGNVQVSVQSFESTKRYTSTQFGNIRTDSDGTILPQTDEYKALSTLNSLQTISSICFIISIIPLVLISLLRRFIASRQKTQVISSSQTDSKILEELSKIRKS